ncbi:MAG: TonB-dependent receptor [Bacteroidetes bacterium]|nr:TonB-dependent receptor [Bacteroidota bacterium]|tara:strand:+ start:2413 stop:4791 length:2379 start_codon:yes stop_codon:yes gene_type:complete
MRLNIILSILLFLLLSSLNYAQESKTDANIIGHVVSHGEHIPFASVYIKGTTIGISADESGHYQLINMPTGKLIVVAKAVGYKPQEKHITLKANTTVEVKFNLEEDVLGLEEVVVTGDRNESNRTKSSTIVNTITPKLFNTIQSVTLSEGLNYCPGVRIENNCSNCGFTQVRMNGMEGPYSQILINSRPIFSGLAGVYGLELIPANMIEKVEIVRGGGSALYGSNAIAGTINLILKDPIQNTYEFGVNVGQIGFGMNDSGGPASDISVNMNTSVVSADCKTGMAVFGFYRNRQPFDANNDKFSEIASLRNITIGTRLYHRFSTRSKLNADFFTINEKRRGGDKFESMPHEANIAEQLKHNIVTGALTYDHYFRKTDMLSIYASGQGVFRDSYYGANMSLKDYGKTNDFTYTVGAQYNATLRNAKLTVGVENDGGFLKDNKLGYPDFENAVIVDDTIQSIPHTENVTVANQTTRTTGVFAQYEHTWNKFKASVGARYDHYCIVDKEHDDSRKTGNVLSPRITFKYDITKYLQTRVSYSQGYRAPQIFDEDLHIESSGSRRIVHKNSPDLKQETSHSYTGSIDFNKQISNVYFGFLVEGFYTRLLDAFTYEYGLPDDEGTVIYLRTNAKGGATVTGVNLEMNLVPMKDLSLMAGFTIQSSKYDDSQEFDDKRFFRTPNDYGYMTFDWSISKTWGVSITGDYTGSMLVPYFGPRLENPDEGKLMVSQRFYDMGFKVRYNTKLNGATLQVYTGIKNIFNSYQSDFDYGIDRDPGYIYGPLNPRTIYFGIKLGNVIN